MELPMHTAPLETRPLLLLTASGTWQPPAGREWPEPSQKWRSARGELMSALWKAPWRTLRSSDPEAGEGCLFSSKHLAILKVEFHLTMASWNQQTVLLYTIQLGGTRRGEPAISNRLQSSYKQTPHGHSHAASEILRRRTCMWSIPCYG